MILRRSARIYDTVRTVHLERSIADSTKVFYRATSYDFDERAASEAGAEKVSRLRAAQIVWSKQYSQIEINEPLMASAWPSTLFYVLVSKFSRAFSSARATSLVSYGIENGPVDLWVSRKLRIPRFLARHATKLVVSFIISGVDRLAIGSEGSAARYKAYLSMDSLRTELRLFPALEPECAACGSSLQDDRNGVVFLGSFETRKGIAQIAGAAIELSKNRPEHSFHFLGKGPLSGMLKDTFGASVLLDPERAEIHDRLSRAKVLVLLSQRSPGWQEQLGLPILEGLSHGCMIVASTETGLAGWLTQKGHRAVEPTIDVAELRDCLTTLLDSDRLPSSVLADLPSDAGGRANADSWMFSREN